MSVSKIPEDHLSFLRQRPFLFGCSSTIFPLDEIQALEQFGNWLEALATGKIQPLTPEQEHFLCVDRDVAEPETLSERAWVRLKGRREFERENKIPPPPASAEQYGMIEFDADRCWW
jgi:uncharacterized protein YifE (UPF0438 family)